MLLELRKWRNVTLIYVKTRCRDDSIADLGQRGSHSVIARQKCSQSQ